MDAFVIDNNIPVPPLPTRASSKFPLALLEVGDSFLHAVENDRNRLASAAHQYGVRHGKKFTVRRVEGGFRVWRIA